MGTSSSPTEAARKVARIAKGLDDAAVRATARACNYGKGVLQGEAETMFGPDRKPSNWRRGRKTVNARYRIDRSSGRVVGVLYPVGDPFYVFVKGRTGGSTIRARKARSTRRNRAAAIPTPRGYFASVKQGAMPARPVHWLRPSAIIIRRTPEMYAEATRMTITKALRG